MLLLVISLFVFQRSLPFHWKLFGVVETVSFFYFSNTLTYKWQFLSDKIFLKKLFQTGLLIRITYVVFIYFFYQFMTDSPFEFEGLDAAGYHNEAIWLTELIKNGRTDQYWHYIQGRYSDFGYPAFLTFFYFLFGPVILVPRIIDAFISAYMSVVLYRLSFRNFGRSAARISAIMIMLFPSLIYYCGLHMKETIMVFLTLLFLERADLVIRQQTLKFSNMLSVFLLGLSIFLFRTVLGIACWFSLITYFLYSEKSKGMKSRRLVIGIILLIGLIGISQSEFSQEISHYYNESTINQQSQLQNYATRDYGNKWAVYGSKIIFVPLIIIAPFPTFVNTSQENAEMIHGALFVRNIIAFFAIIALIYLFQNGRYRRHILIVTLTLTYLGILALSGFAFSERFHVPILPFLIMFAGFGVTVINKRQNRYFIPYLIFIFLIIIGWNWFKLAGRGMI